MLLLKEGVLVAGTSYINTILAAAQKVYSEYHWDVVVTAGRDGHHMSTSYHAQDRALDIRHSMIPPENRQAVRNALHHALPAFYDVVLEKDHYHIEADARKEREH